MAAADSALLHRGAAGFRQAGGGLSGCRHQGREALRARHDAIREMIAVKKPVIFDCRVDKHANCFPMIPSGEAHNHMLMGDDLTEEDLEDAITEEGKVMV